jgi:hypothetical protein
VGGEDGVPGGRVVIGGFEGCGCAHGAHFSVWMLAGGTCLARFEGQ